MTTSTSRRTRIAEENCMRCGLCVSVCPQGCLSFEEYPVKGDGCSDCGLCEAVCPGSGVLLRERGECFSSGRCNEDVGWYANAYVGYSTEEAVRERATSGGVVTSLLGCLLEHDIVDRVSVVTFDEKEPWKTRYVAVTSKKDVLGSAQTKYQVTPFIVPLQGERMAVVGLPCLIEGLRNAEEKIGGELILIGLFCWVNMEREATEFLLNKMKVNTEEVQSIEYRSGNYLGGFRVWLKDGRMKFLGKECYNVLPFLFAPERCLLCADFTNELADISVGDAKFMKSKKGHTFVLTRSEKGEKLVRDCAHRGYIRVEECDVRAIVQSESSALLFKKGAYRRVTGRINYGRGGKGIPLKNRLFELIFLNIHRNRRILRRLFEVMPLSFFSLISKLITRGRN